MDHEESAELPKTPSDALGFFERLGRNLDQMPQVQSASDKAARVKKAAETATRQTKDLGDLMGGALQYVKKHPAQGVIAAAVAGFFLGRLFRR